MKLIRNSSMILAGFILLMHTFVPHEHHSELNQAEHLAQHESASGFFDFLALAFHLDQGEGHLEEYQPASNEFIRFQAVLVATLVFDFHVLSTSETALPAISNEAPPPNSYLDHPLQFRGPPASA